MQTPKLFKSLLLFTFIIIIFLAWTLTPLQQVFNPENLWKLSLKIENSFWTPITLLALFSFGTCLFLPVVLVALICSMIYPFWQGLLLSLSGVFFASLTGYGLGKWVGIHFLPQSIIEKIETLSDHFKDATIWTVLGLRIAPTPPFTLTSLLSGMFKIPVLPYSIGTVIGMIPMMTLIQIFGSRINELIKNPSFLAFFSVIAVVIFIFVYNLIKKRLIRERSLS